MNADDKGHPRLIVQDTDLERTLKYMKVLDEEDDLDEEVKNTLMLLKDCWPMGSKRDVRGASFKQLKFVCQLARFDVDQTRQCCRVVNLAGGMDSLQAHHLINELLDANDRSRKS
jgi:hypothetical protein